MIEQLSAALGKEFGLTSKEIADVVWLALQMEASEPSFQTGEAPSIGRDEKTDGKSLSSEPSPSRSDVEWEDSKKPPSPQAELHATDSRSDEGDGFDAGLPLAVPDARSLREPLSLAKSLKPMLQKISAGWSPVLDEVATVERIAGDRIWMPVLKPALEPWLDLALVVEESLSMHLWQRTVAELQRLLAHYGVFRDVRVWSLTSDDLGRVQIRPRLGNAARRQSVRRPRELIDPSGRRLILVATDCVSQIWQDGSVLPVLKLWASSSPMAIVQMLPEWLWSRTGLGLASRVRFHSLMPGVPNQQLEASDLSPWDEVDLEAGIRVPVVTLEPEPFLAWANMMIARGGTRSPGFVFEPEAMVSWDESSQWNASVEETAQERVQQFRSTASPVARRLAGLLAAAPVVSLPVVRILRERLLPKSRQVHVAEVFLGGLLKPLLEIQLETDPDVVRYEFLDGVRSLLLESVPTKDSVDVIYEVSAFVAERMGLSLEEFVAVLRNPRQAENRELASQSRPFARVAARILKQLGGRYSELANALMQANQTNGRVEKHEDLLDEIYNAFTPTPLLPGDPAYVDCWAVRGDEDVVVDLGGMVRRSQGFTCQLYCGYRGSGKTTELYRLKKYLEDRNHVVVYFAADEEDISVQDAQYTDILLACARHLLEELSHANPEPILNWFKGGLWNLQDVMLTEIDIKSINLEVGLREFAKLTAAVRAEPRQRQKIRERIEPNTETLIQALNAFIEDSRKHLPETTKLVVIVDNLDRIVPIFRDNGRSNHEEIFLDHHEQLKALNCHIIYTVPISLVYSRWATELKDNYGIPQVLPSIMVRRENNDPYEKGLDILKKIICLRLPVSLRDSLVPDVFESEAVLQELCLMSGGYLRQLVVLMQRVIAKVDMLPIRAREVQRAVDDLRDVYRRAVEEDQWAVLREVHQSKEIYNDKVSRSLLFSRCVLEYRNFDNNDDKQTWYDVHPVLWKEL
ncbi:MAG: SAV_2336 N-terminal domain-related protein [Cyanobacteriota bacterium]|nr:SAV_2336 N-terminal domain-related protein [Cyanobacteriota bacterium]